MSFYGLDLLDSFSANRFDSDSRSSSRSRSPSDNESEIRSFFGSLLRSADTSHNEGTVEPPVSWIAVDNNTGSSESEGARRTSSEDDLSTDEITILSSVPSSQASAISLRRTRPSTPVLSSAIQTLPQSRHEATAPFSISTTDSVYIDNVSLFSSSVLSFSPSLVESSALEEISLHTSDYESIHRQQLIASGSLVTVRNKQKMAWYSHFSEEDWENFRQEMRVVMQALAAEGEHIEYEQQLAMLIQQEEVLFWNEENSREKRQQNENRRRCQKGAAFLGELGLFVLAAATASLGAPYFARG